MLLGDAMQIAAAEQDLARRHAEDLAFGEVTREQLAEGGGLAGLSGIEGGDMRDLEQAAAAGNAGGTVAEGFHRAIDEPPLAGGPRQHGQRNRNAGVDPVSSSMLTSSASSQSLFGSLISSVIFSTFRGLDVYRT